VRPGHGLALLAVLALLAAGAATLGGAAGASPSRSRAGRLAGAVPPSARVELDLVLRVRENAVRRYLRGLYDPRSPLYGHYLSPTGFGRRFGLSGDSLASLRARLRASGFRILAAYPDRTAVRVAATAATVERVFGVTLRTFVAASGRRYRSPDRQARVPRSLARWATAVGGLDTRPLATVDSLPAEAIRPDDARTAYDLAPLYQKANGSVDGHGQTIAVLSIDHFSQQHVDAFSKQYGLPLGLRVQSKRISAADLSTYDESDMDIEIVHSVAPRAQIVDYETSWSDLAKAIRRVTSDGKARIVSGSFGACDGTILDSSFGSHAELDGGFRSDVESALLVAATKGISFFFSSGDVGAYDCQRAYPKDGNLTVHFPSDAPYAVSVGGTVLSVGGDGSYQGETSWGDTSGNGGAGGGLNPFDPRPPWQAKADVAGISNGKRQVPDVSAAAGSASPWFAYTTAEDDTTHKNFTGFWLMSGTSASTPFWAASMLLVQQYLEQKHAGPVCFAAPLLYALGSTGWRFPPFHDVTVGTNRYYQAGPGWDFASGIGSPDVYNLATAAAVYRKQHPLPAAANACRSQAG
jgi:subtilase family serine protease